MCRSIRTLFNFAPPATETEIRAAALQFVRKIAGTTKPSRANVPAFERAVQDVFRVSQRLVTDLVATTPPRDREVEAMKARERSRRRFGT